MTSHRVSCMVLLLFLSCYAVGPATGQDVHSHTPGVSGVPQGVPYFCANPTVTSVATGPWSDAKTWAGGKVPQSNDKVTVATGHTVTLDTATDTKLDCIQIDGNLRFATDRNTRVQLANLMVTDAG